MACWLVSSHRLSLSAGRGGRATFSFFPVAVVVCRGVRLSVTMQKSLCIKTDTESITGRRTDAWFVQNRSVSIDDDLSRRSSGRQPAVLLGQACKQCSQAAKQARGIAYSKRSSFLADRNERNRVASQQQHRNKQQTVIAFNHEQRTRFV